MALSTIRIRAPTMKTTHAGFRQLLPILPGLVLVVPWAPQAVAAQSPVERFASAIEFRNLGPFRAGAWISDVAVDLSDARRNTWYVATRNGGLWKTVNRGTTFAPVFDGQGPYSIGAVAIAASDPAVVWLGTGEAYSARSSYRGDGVYRSDDGGASWRHVGLEDSHHVARIVVHPRNPDIAWVAAMGHLYSPNDERGVYKTTDGGRTWRRVLSDGPRVGAVDLVMSPADPDVLWAALYELERYPWTLVEGGPGSGIYRSDDGGETWTRERTGLPEGRIGRIGIDVFRGDPDRLYAVVENANLRPPTEQETAADQRRGRPPEGRVLGGEVYRSDDGGRTWQRMNSAQDDVGGKAAYSFNQIRVDPADGERIFVTTVTIANSDDGGRTWSDIDWPPRRVMPRMFGDVRTLWIDPAEPDFMIAGTDGGLQVSYDGGRTSSFTPNLPLGEVYALGVDMDDPYRIYAGLQDHESWRGPSNGWSGAISIEDWITVGAGDGMYNVVDPTDSRWLWNTSQFGDHYRVDQQRGERTRIVPTRPTGEPRLRFTWTTPLAISPHDPRTIYTGAQVVLRSDDRGDTWREISPDLTTNDSAKIDGRGNIQYCTITTIAESPTRAGVIWAGTDDGRVQVTRDGGATWRDVTAGLVRAGSPEERWVMRVTPSGRAEGTAWVARSGYAWDDFRPLLYRTRDFGETWEAIAGDLPAGPANVILEDDASPGLLYAGTDSGVFFSLDAGTHWTRFTGVPAVPVRDLALHPREHDLLVGTYGRGIWVADMTSLRQLTGEVLAAGAWLFEPEPKGRRIESGWGNYRLYGDAQVVTPNESNGMVIEYWLAREQEAPARITIRDSEGATIARLDGTASAGLNHVLWPLRDQRRTEVEPGRFEVVLEAGGARLTRPARVLPPVLVARR